ncbi:MAG: FGGY-family carbohydrate kinase [Microbacterium sp.]|uniref:FGGY-family carbohydrate kinase n=1 Tax=Microbacterium sp. TaxID=51671 RepID=UPI0039E61288
MLAIDIGSTTVKAARFSVDGARSGEVAVRRHRVGVTAALDLERVLRAVLEVVDGVGARGVEAVALTTVWQTVVRVGPDGGIRGEPATWESAPSAAAMRRVRDAVGASWDHSVSGAYLHSSYPLLVAAAERALAADDRLQDVGSWLVERLTGTSVGWSEPIAAGSGLWDQRRRSWSNVADNLGVRAQLERAPLHTDVVEASRLHPGLPTALRSARWAPPLPDGLCHNLGVGAIDDAVAITVGTSGSVRAVLTADPDGSPSGLWHYRCGHDTHALGGAISTAGNLLEWVCQLTGDNLSWSWAEGVAPRLPSIRAVPDVYGRRGPDYPFDATGSVIGLRPHHTLADLADAFSVDMWSRFALLYRLLSRTHPIVSARAGGGVIERVPVAAQILADALGVPVAVSAADQPALRGAALVASALLRPLGKHFSAVDHVARAIAAGETEPPAFTRSAQPREAWTRALAERWADAPPPVDARQPDACPQKP